MVEFGTNNDMSQGDSTPITDDTLTSTNQEEVQLDDSTRSKLSSLGTNLWLNIQNNPKVFRDYISSMNDTTSSTPEREAAQDESKHDSFLLQKVRAAASGYIRSLACRLVLITKIQTKGLVVPKLVLTTTASKSHDHSHSKTNGDPPTRPLAMNAELEFAFKSLSRAGRAMLGNHSSSTFNTSSTPNEFLPDVFDPSAAYTTLCLALEFWSSLDQTHKMNNNYSKRSLFLDEAFDVMLLLPDCVMTLKRTEIDGSRDDTSPDYDIAKSTITQLKRLENFINDQISTIESHRNHNQELKTMQYFLPSLARTSYKVRITACLFVFQIKH